MTGIDGTHHLRAKPRFKLFQPVQMIASGGARRVHLLNLSAGGALVHAADPPAPGTAIQLCPGASFRSARVAWTNGRRFGVTFTTPLPDAHVAQVIADQATLVATASQRIAQLA
jgi:hypothetical protein